MRAWKCPGCRRTIQHSYEALVDVGIPICGQDGCDNEDGEMEMIDEPMPKYGYGWVDGEDDDEGDRWVRIAELDYANPTIPVLGEEIAVILLRDAKDSERKFPGITTDRERKAELIVDALNGQPSTPKVKLVIEMYGNTIQSCHKDNPYVELTDVVFLEHPKYASEVGDEVIVASGRWQNLFVYSHYDAPDWSPPDSFVPVMEACQQRIDANEGNHES